MRDAFLKHQAMQGCRIIGSRKHKFYTRGGACEGQPPTRGVEHWNDRQQDCLWAKVKNGWSDFGHCVQHG